MLEKSKITHQPPIRSPRFFPRDSNVKTHIRSDYKTKINGYEVRAIFETSIETGESFLYNAWVVEK